MLFETTEYLLERYASMTVAMGRSKFATLISFIALIDF